MDDAARLFEAQRPRLIAICYRMLGERAAAEDVVQDTWLRWAAVDHDSIRVPAAWLTRTATRIAIDVLRSARARRETYVGPWLPEPLVATADSPPETDFILAQECGLALLWAMERLDANERAAFVLREAFDVDYGEVARVLGKSEAACRQMVSRARKRINSTVPRFDVPKAQVSELMQRLFIAAQSNDFDAVKQLLAPNAVALSDGGATVRAARRPLVGPAEIAQVLLSLQRKHQQDPGWNMVLCEANGSPALLSQIHGRTDAIITLMPNEEGQISWIYTMRAPPKLVHVPLIRT